jgi:hypothetical protein
VKKSDTPTTKRCSVFGCGRTVQSRGWCQTHYRRWLKHGDVLENIPVQRGGGKLWSPDPAPTVVCSVCGIEKEVSLYPQRFGKLYGRQCKLCLAAMERNRRATSPEYRQQQNLAWRRSMLKRNYSLTLEEFDDIVAAQGGGCAICGRQNFAGRYLAVDHNHDTGKVRGVLCDGCNRAIGQFQDDPDLLEKAAIYIREND